MPRFTIRDVLWLMLVVGVLVAWAVDRRRLSASVEKAEWRARIAAEDATWANDLQEIRNRIEQIKRSK